ncbi:MAG: hypothetical protein OXP73_01790 [Chloroflexota bacterium]|nr:hypothetical protein [Chloroflexota bacterium]
MGPIDMLVEPRAECETNFTKLSELTRIHLSIEEPSRGIGADESDWIHRLRKVCLHVRALKGWEIDDIDVVHVLAPEIRAAYVQLDEVWQSMPQEFKLVPMDSDYWSSEARAGVLATYDHPSPFNLIIGPTALGSFSTSKPDETYLQLAVWLGFLVLGYGLALAYLAEVLGAEDEDIVSRLAEVDANGSDMSAVTAHNSPTPRRGERPEDV